MYIHTNVSKVWNCFSQILLYIFVLGRLFLQSTNYLFLHSVPMTSRTRYSETTVQRSLITTTIIWNIFFLVAQRPPHPPPWNKNSWSHKLLCRTLEPAYTGPLCLALEREEGEGKSERRPCCQMDHKGSEGRQIMFFAGRFKIEWGGWRRVQADWNVPPGSAESAQMAGVIVRLNPWQYLHLKRIRQISKYRPHE